MKRWQRDSGLSARMFLTMFMLFVLYIVFIGVLDYLGLPLGTILLVAGVMLFAQYYYSDKMVLYSTGARVVTESEEPGLHEIVSRLCIEADLPKPRIAVVNSSVPNAFATGRSPKKALVAVTTALTQRLDRNEVAAVLAHELTHVKNRDVMVLTIASFFSTIAFFLVRYLIFFGGSRRGGGQIMIAWVASIAVWIVSSLLIRALSRYREFAADRGAAIITGHPSHLVSALMKISGSMDRVPTEDLRKAEGMNAFYIIPVISKSSIMALFSTHPPLKKRVAALEKISREMELA
uniref:Protease HtpX homolog n=1 Tax=Candidatus Methanogaster sp. ANME-2c ERB4 TaxID=2759911 RepID=A0A7G9Y9K7_9EURY|nr:protease HtpX [Methanosarcinales archaeon ANME-2c ERB4]QNO43609.1 protease HtpX [Methanosarcinales archaeon ANME-2c ERB4]QNO44691.1 protease HtpX [Methanosarcinales archaeon ANME-2c ERB4]QNO50326.1 protease HtpX [Methanosarcinales archaeon ANME-2c ERB4]